MELRLKRVRTNQEEETAQVQDSNKSLHRALRRAPMMVKEGKISKQLQNCTAV